MDDTIYRQAAIDALRMDISIIPFVKAREYVREAIETIYNRLEELPPAQPEYEELTPEEAASEIACETLMSAWYWLDDLIRLKQMGYVICRKR